MAQVEMIVDCVKISQVNYQRVVILKEKAGVRCLPIWIGLAEADALAVNTQGVELSRPLTHDVLCAAVEAVGGRLQSSTIDKLEEDIFHAKIVLQAAKEQKVIDCRASDAIAVAVRRAMPIFVDEEVLRKASIVLEDTDSPGQRVAGGHLDKFSKEVLDILAASAVETRHMHHDYTSTGHLLIGLASRKNTASDIMKTAGADLGKIREDLTGQLMAGHPVEGGGGGLTPALKEVIRLSIDEANKVSSLEVLPEHVLLGLLRATDGIAAGKLADLGITPERVYVELLRLRQ